MSSRDRVKFYATSSGTGSFIPASALTGFRTPATAAMADGSVISYVAVNPSNLLQWELGKSVYVASGPSIARSPSDSSNGGSVVNFGNPPIVAVCILFDDLMVTADPLMVRQFVTHPWDDFDDADGTPMIGRTTPSGTPWVVSGAGAATAIINSQGYENTSAGTNSYAYLTDANAISEIECVVSWMAVASQNGFDGTSGVMAFVDASNSLTKILHLQFHNQAWNLLKTTTGPGGLVPLSGTPVELNGVPITIGTWWGGPLKIDGTRYKIRMVADTSANTLTIYFPDGTALQWTDSVVSSVVAATAFWEHDGNGTTGFADMRFNGCAIGSSKAGSIIEACSNKDTALTRSFCAAVSDWQGQIAFPQAIVKTTNGWYTIAQQNVIGTIVPKMGGTVTVFGQDANGVHCLLEITVGAEIPSSGVPQTQNIFAVTPLLGAWAGGIVDQVRLSADNSGGFINLDISINNSAAVTLYAQYRGMFVPVVGPVVGATALTTWSEVLPARNFYELTAPMQWNSIDKTSSMDITGNGLIATPHASAEEQVRCTTSHSVGRFYAELTVTVKAGGAETFGFGLASASHSFSDYLGQTESPLMSVGYFDDGAVLYNSAQLLATNVNTAFVATNTIGLAVDLVNYKLYVKNITTASNWNNNGSADPATGIGGLDISTLGKAPFFLAVDIEHSGDSGTLNAGSSAFVGSLPAGGYQAWG